MRVEMIKKEELTSCVIKAMTFVTVVYVLVSIPPILAFGQPGGTLLADVNQFFLYIGSAGIVVHVFIALPIILNVFYNTMALTVLPMMKTRSPISVLIRFVVLALAFVVPLVFGKLGALIDLVSAITMIATMIFFPIIFNIVLLMQRDGSFGSAVKAIGIFSFIWQMVMMLVGVFALVEGIKNGVKELAGPSQCPLHKFLI